MQKQRSLTIDKPHVLILHEHHDNRYLLVQNEDDLYRIALEILDWRFGGEKENHGYYVLEEPEMPSQQDILSKEEIAKLPSGSIREFAKKTLTNYEMDLAIYHREKDKYDAIHETLKQKNGKRAWQILQAMSNAGGEDDEIDLIPLETTYSFK